MIAAHSLGSIVVHNFLVRHWQTDAASVPDTLITFGSPIGVSAVDTATGLKGAGIEHRFLGPAKLTAVGSSHTEYFNDKEGFLALLLQAAGLAPDASEDVETGRSARGH